MARPLIVLDTNVVLDWLVFRDPSCELLGAEIEAGRLRWIASAAMRSEFDHVLARPQFDANRSNEGIAYAGWSRLCTTVEAPTPSGAAVHMRCTDPDDQMFIDLALSMRAAWLLSRDRAVLNLASRARAVGTLITKPASWAVWRTTAP